MSVPQLMSDEQAQGLTVYDLLDRMLCLALGRGHGSGQVLGFHLRALPNGRESAPGGDRERLRGAPGFSCSAPVGKLVSPSISSGWLRRNRHLRVEPKSSPG